MSQEHVQRRLAAILCADVAGYSRLMGADEEGTLAALNAHRVELIDPCLADFRGRLVKSTGDGLLAEFPSVVDAVRCAVAIQNGMRARNAKTPASQRLEFRIGVNLGDVIVQDDDIYGDGVNLAARLQQFAAVGGICLSEEAFRQVRGKLALNATDAGEQRFKNIADPIRVYRIAVTADSKAAPDSRAGMRRAHAPSILLAGLGLLLAVAAGAYWASHEWIGDWDRFVSTDSRSASRTERDFPVVAVLPFANQTDDQDQEYLADGVTEEVIDALGRFTSLRVISFHAVSAFKSPTIVRDSIAKDLAANYLVEGSVRRTGDQVRIAARLIDAGASTVLWTDRYDGPQSGILDIQDAIVREVAGKLAAKIAHIKGQQALQKARPDLDAYDLFLRARAIGFAANRKANRQCRELTAKAIALDPKYAAAHALRAEAIYARAVLGWAATPDQDLAEAEATARKAIQLAPDESEGHRALGRILVTRAEYDEAREELRRAIDINPSDATALAAQGIVLVYEGDLAAAIKSLELARKFDPALESSGSFHLSLAYFLNHMDADALRVIRQGIARYPDFAMSYVLGAVVATRLGQVEQAKRFAEEAHRRLPFLNPDALGSRLRVREHRTYLQQGLRTAGF